MMQLSDAFKTSVTALKSNKSRSILTMLGIVIGISSVILLVSLGRGAEGLILGQLATFSPKSVFVEPGRGDMQGPPIGVDMTTLKLRDVEAIRNLDTIEMVSGVIMRNSRVTYQREDHNVMVVGTNPEEQDIYSAYPIYGRFLDEVDVDSRARVAVLGYSIAQDLFGDRELAVGQTIKINRKTFQVIGVMEERGAMFFTDFDKNIYVPVTTAQRILYGVDYVNFLSAVATDSVEEAIDDIRLTLRDQHDIDNPEADLSKDDFIVTSQVEAEEIVTNVTGVMALLLISIAAISLVVGGVGIMNIMLVSVTERTREIGLRKAVGARYKDILTQFLLEAVVLTFVGGVVGILVGILLSFLASFGAKLAGFDDWVFTVPIASIIVAVFVATAVGLVFGIFPARKAAKLDPIEALRYE